MFDKQTIKNCTLYHGDCYEIMQDLAGSNIDCMITDPPYGCTCNEWDHDIDLGKFWTLSKAACKDNAPFVIFCQMPFAARLYMSNPKMFRYEWIYKKPKPTNFLNAKLRPLSGHESIYIFCSCLPKYYPQMKNGKSIKFYGNDYKSGCYKYKALGASAERKSDRYPVSIIDVVHDNLFYNTYNRQIKIHPTQKSVAALSYLVKTYTNAGDTVIDPFMGSGSTGVAAVKHNRKFIGIKQDAKWFDVACKRIEAEYQDRALLDICEPEKPKAINKQASLI